MGYKVIPNTSYGNLSGNFRLASREYGAVNFLRNKMRMNIDHIAKVLGRSKASVHRVIRISGLPRIDNRGQTKNAWKVRQYDFDHMKHNLRIKVKLYLKGLVDTLDEALVIRMVPLSFFECENSDGEEDEDPA